MSGDDFPLDLSIERDGDSVTLTIVDEGEDAVSIRMTLQGAQELASALLVATGSSVGESASQA